VQQQQQQQYSPAAGIYNPRPANPAHARVVLAPAVDPDGTPRLNARLELRVRRALMCLVCLVGQG
jgi:hypothetical protein